MDNRLNVKVFIPLIARASHPVQIDLILECLEKCIAYDTDIMGVDGAALLDKAIERAKERLNTTELIAFVAKTPISTTEEIQVSDSKFKLEPATGYLIPDSTDIVPTKDEAVQRYMIYNLNQIAEEDWNGRTLGEHLHLHLDDLKDIVDETNYGETA